MLTIPVGFYIAVPPYSGLMIAIAQIRATFVDPVPVQRIVPRKELLTAFQAAGIALEVSLYAVLRATGLELAQDCPMSVVVRTVYKGLGSTSHTWRDHIRDSEVPVSRVPGSTNFLARQQAEIARFGRLWRYETEELSIRQASPDIEIMSKSLGTTSLSPRDDLMESRGPTGRRQRGFSNRSKRQQPSRHRRRLDRCRTLHKIFVNPEALNLVTRLASIDQERAGLSFEKGSALRFLLWGAERFTQAIVSDLYQLAYYEIP